MRPIKETRYFIISDTDEAFEYKTIKKARRIFEEFTQVCDTVTLVKQVGIHRAYQMPVSTITVLNRYVSK